MGEWTRDAGKLGFDAMEESVRSKVHKSVVLCGTKAFFVCRDESEIWSLMKVARAGVLVKAYVLDGKWEYVVGDGKKVIGKLYGRRLCDFIRSESEGQCTFVRNCTQASIDSAFKFFIQFQVPFLNWKCTHSMISSQAQRTPFSSCFTT